MEHRAQSSATCGTGPSTICSQILSKLCQRETSFATSTFSLKLRGTGTTTGAISCSESRGTGTPRLWSPSYSHSCSETRIILLRKLASDIYPPHLPTTFVLTSKRFANCSLTTFSDERVPDDPKSSLCTMILMCMYWNILFPQQGLATA